MKKAFIVFVLISCVLRAQAQIDSLNSPTVWLRADKSELTATGWKDVSLYARHATAQSATETPILGGTINFNKALLFDGADDCFSIPYSLDDLANLSVLAVFQSADTTERGIWGTEQSSLRNILLTTRKVIGPDTIADGYGKNEKTTVLSSVFQNCENTSKTASSSYLALGSAGRLKPYKSFKGLLAELLVFNRSLTFLDRVKFETYLAIKYGTGLHTTNFVSSDEKVLWHSEQNKKYGRNIAGIGRDDAFDLYQKQSGSAYDSGLIVMSAGKLTNTNAENDAALNNQDFILWGDNGSPLRVRRGEGVDSVLSITQRRWLVSASGKTANRIPLELHLDAANLAADPLGYWLVIDRSGKEDFSVDNIEYVLPQTISNGKIVYNVRWDTDGSGKDHFGFARAHELFAVVRNVADPSCTDAAAGKVRIEIIAGKAPFQYALTNAEAKLERSWKQSQSATDLTELVAGAYTLTVKDDEQETITRNFKMHMPDALVIDLGPDQTLTKAKEITLDVSVQIPDSVVVDYHWQNNFGFSSADKKIRVTESGIYGVSVTKQKDGCVFTDEITISGSETQRIAVYPNMVRTNDNYNVSISLEKAGPVSVKVFNSLGIAVHGMDGMERSEYQFNASFKDTGMYLLVIQTPNGIETRKVVVQ